MTRRRSSVVTGARLTAIAATGADCLTLAIASSRPGFVEVHPLAIALLATGGIALALAMRAALAVVWLWCARAMPRRGAIAVYAIAIAAATIRAWSNLG